MAASTIQTFGVDYVALQAHLPQIGMVGTDDPLTTARLAQLVNEAAAEVCSMLLGAGITPSGVAAETTSVAYYQCQRLVIALTLPSLMRAVSGVGFGASADIEAAETRARTLLARIEANPTMLGWDSDTDDTPGAWSSTSEYSDLATTSPQRLREWGLRTDGSPGPEW